MKFFCNAYQWLFYYIHNFMSCAPQSSRLKLRLQVFHFEYTAYESFPVEFNYIKSFFADFHPAVSSVFEHACQWFHCYV